MDALKKLLDKKKSEGYKMGPDEQKSRMKVLGELRGMANEEIGKDLPSLKKVTVASGSKEGLEEGLHKASDMVEGGQMEAMENAASESADEDEYQEENQPEESAHGDNLGDGMAYDEACHLAKSLSPEEKKKLIEELSSGE